MSATPKRRQKGITDGGQFAETTSPESTVELAADSGLGWPVPTRQERVWTSDLTGYPKPPQRERAPYPYALTIPPEIAGVEVLLPSDVAALTEDAARSVERLDASVFIANCELGASSLLRSEAVSSSRIEGLRASHRSIAAARENPAAANAIAREIANSVDSMDEAIRLATQGPLTLDVINQIHTTLAKGTSLEATEEHCGPSRIGLDRQTTDRWGRSMCHHRPAKSLG